MNHPFWSTPIFSALSIKLVSAKIPGRRSPRRSESPQPPVLNDPADMVRFWWRKVIYICPIDPKYVLRQWLGCKTIVGHSLYPSPFSEQVGKSLILQNAWFWDNHTKIPQVDHPDSYFDPSWPIIIPTNRSANDFIKRIVAAPIFHSPCGSLGSQLSKKDVSPLLVSLGLVKASCPVAEIGATRYEAR